MTDSLVNSMTQISFQEMPNDIPFVKVRFGKEDKPYLALVDTGSALTLFEESIYDDYCLLGEKEDKVEMDITGINGEKSYGGRTLKPIVRLEDSENHTLDFKAWGCTFDFSSLNDFYKEVYNLDKRIVMLLGADTMRSLGIMVDFSGKTLLMNQVKDAG